MAFASFNVLLDLIDLSAISKSSSVQYISFKLSSRYPPPKSTLVMSEHLLCSTFSFILHNWCFTYRYGSMSVSNDDTMGIIGCCRAFQSSCSLNAQISPRILWARLFISVCV